MSDIDRAERLAAEIDGLMAELVQIVRDAKNAPRSGRNHWVFVHRCGCAFGVMDAGDARGGAEERAAAWASFYEDRTQEGFVAIERGVSLTLANHGYYVEHFEQQLRDGCPHQAGGAS